MALVLSNDFSQEAIGRGKPTTMCVGIWRVIEGNAVAILDRRWYSRRLAFWLSIFLLTMLDELNIEHISLLVPILSHIYIFRCLNIFRASISMNFILKFQFKYLSGFSYLYTALWCRYVFFRILYCIILYRIILLYYITLHLYYIITISYRGLYSLYNFICIPCKLLDLLLRQIPIYLHTLHLIFYCMYIKIVKY